MPEIEDFTCSREATIAAFEDYYSFLVDLYMDPFEIIYPPEGGWPSISTEFQEMIGKSDEVIALLRHLPYIDESYEAQGTPTCYWADWQSLAANAVTYPAATGTIPNGEGLRICSEGGEASEDVPADVIGLTYGGRENKTLLLDTRLGVVYWPESDDGGNYAHNMDNDPSFIQTVWGIEDHVPENEMEWRNEPAWAVEVFFEMLKKQYRELKWIPTSARRVLASDFSFGDDQEGMIDMLRGIYREHGWGGEGYRKRECLEAVEKALKEQYPTFDEWI